MCPIFDFECPECDTVEEHMCSADEKIVCEKCKIIMKKIHIKAPTWDWSDRVLPHKVNRFNKRNPNNKQRG